MVRASHHAQAPQPAVRTQAPTAHAGVGLASGGEVSAARIALHMYLPDPAAHSTGVGSRGGFGRAAQPLHPRCAIPRYDAACIPKQQREALAIRGPERRFRAL